MAEQKKSEEEIQAWLDQVHFGSCCSDEPDSCEEGKNEKGSSYLENPAPESDIKESSKS